MPRLTVVTCFPSRSLVGGKVGLVLASTAVALLVAEVALRLFGYAGQQERLAVEFDDTYGDVEAESWIYGPPLVPGGRFAPHQFEHEVNKPEDTWRMLFVGDSGTAGSGVGARNAFPLQFRRIHDGGGRVEVINTGVPGLTTVGELRLLRDRLLVLEPDVVVLGLFMANDLQHNLTQVRGARWPHAGWIRRRSALGHLLFLRFLAHSAGTPFSPAPAEEHGIPMNDYVGGELAGYITPVPPTFRLAYQVLEETLRQLGELSRAHDFELAVVLVPTLSTLTGELRFPDPEDTRRWSRFDLQPGERIDVGQPTREVMAICARLELVCVDPTEALATHLGADAILEDDDHPTVAAHRLIAAQLYRRLAQEPERFLGLPAR